MRTKRQCKISGFFLVLLVLLVSMITSFVCARFYEINQRSQARNVLEFTRKTIESVFSEIQTSAITLAESMETSFNTSHFEEMAEAVLHNEDNLCAFLVKKDEVVSALPKELVSEETGKHLNEYPYAFSIAEVLQESVIDGPLQTDQGFKYFLFASPIIQNDVCIGQVIIAVDAASVLEKMDLASLKEIGYEYELWKIDLQDGHKNMMESSGEQMDLSNAEQISFYIPTECTLMLRPTDGWVSFTARFLILFGNICFFLSLLAWVFYVKVVKRCRKEKSEAACRDYQTGFLNRTGFRKELEKQMKSGKTEYTIFFFAMDEWISLARRMGEEDRKNYMEYILYRMKNYIYNDHIFARVGESSYVVAVFEKLNRKQATDLARGFSLDLLWKTEIRGKRVYIHADWNFLQCPEDANEPAELIERVILEYAEREAEKAK